MKPYFIIAVAIISFLWAGAVGASTPTSAGSCARGDLLISEVDYDQPNTDNLEFVELNGTPNSSLNGYELRFIDSAGSIYHTISLRDKSVTPSGFFVVGNPGLFNDPQMYLSDNTLSDDKAVVAVYDMTNGAYCNAVNYEGTVIGFSDWLNIGFDTDGHGEGRGCARAASGWWSCNRPTTPGGSNGVVAVQLNATNTSVGTPFSILLLLGFCLLMSARLVVYRQR